MSVLHLRRDMVVDEEPESVEQEASSRSRGRGELVRGERASSGRSPKDEEPVVEIEAALPIPLRRYEQPVEVEARIVGHPVDIDADEDDGHHRSFFDVLSGWTKVAAVIALLAAYPALMVRASDVGDRDVASLVDRTLWAAPWAGAAATVMERHFSDIGWASDAPGWAPEARLTAKPAYQSALAAAFGEFAALRADQEAAAGREDPDLLAAARLATPASTGIQMRAASDALLAHDRRVRRRAGDGPAAQSTPAEIAAQLGLINSWAAASQAEFAASSAALGGSPLDDIATQAVSRARARALAAYVFIDATPWPQDATLAAARTNALEAWNAALQFRPMVVFNGSPDGSIFGNHASSMGYLFTKAQAATSDYLSKVHPLAQPSVAAEAPNPAPPA